MLAIESNAHITDPKHLELENPISFVGDVKVIMLYDESEKQKTGSTNNDWEDFFRKIQKPVDLCSFTRDEANER